MAEGVAIAPHLAKVLYAYRISIKAAIPFRQCKNTNCFLIGREKRCFFHYSLEKGGDILFKS